jgi:NADH:ubiquinone oxidoreductase subunit 6 (subunit J)
VTALGALPIPDLTQYLPAILFYAFALLAVGSAIAAATAPRIVHAAFGLMAAFLGVAGLYALLGSDFLALTQIIVYVGGILILIVFGVLLTGRVKSALGLEREKGIALAVVAGTVLLLGLLLSLVGTDFHPKTELTEPPPTTADLGRAFLMPEQYLLPFELVSVFLLLALVGAAYLVRRRRAPEPPPPAPPGAEGSAP